MKAIVYSWFVSGNLGDILISKCVSDLFSEYFDCRFFDISSGKEEAKPTFIINTAHASEQSLKNSIIRNRLCRSIIDFSYSIRKKVIVPFENLQTKNCKIAIFAGGNSLMDIDPFLPGQSILTYRRVKELKKQGYYVAFCFCGAGPFSNPLSRRIFKRTLKLIDFISVRDEASLNLCNQFGRSEKIEIWRDPVMLMQTSSSFKERNTIAINVYFGPDRRQRESMKNSYLWLVSFLRTKYPNMKIALFATETADMVDVYTISGLFQNDSFIEVSEIIDVESLFDFYKSCYILIGCRMHSLITAVISSIPIVAIGWQKKVFSLMSYLKYDDRVISKDSFCNCVSDITEIVERAMNTDSQKLNRIQEMLQRERILLSGKLAEFSKQWR